MRFGPSGNSESFFAQGHKATIEQPKWLHESFGLTAFEYSFGRGVRIKEESARAIGEEFARYGIQLSVHAPYFINLATEDEEKKQNCLQMCISDRGKDERRCNLCGRKTRFA